MVSAKFWSFITFGLGKESPQSKAAAAHAKAVKESKKVLDKQLDRNIAPLVEYLELFEPMEEDDSHDPDSLDTQDDADLTLMSGVDEHAPKVKSTEPVCKLFSQADLARLLKMVHYYHFYLKQRVRAGKATVEERNLISHLAGATASIPTFANRLLEVHQKIERTDIMSPMLPVHYSELLNMLTLLKEDINR